MCAPGAWQQKPILTGPATCATSCEKNVLGTYAELMTFATLLFAQAIVTSVSLGKTWQELILNVSDNSFFMRQVSLSDLSHF